MDDYVCDCGECEDGEPICGIVGQCQAGKGDRGITNCIHCGKELHEKDGQWYTHDADQYQNPVPQDRVH